MSAAVYDLSFAKGHAMTRASWTVGAILASGLALGLAAWAQPEKTAQPATQPANPAQPATETAETPDGQAVPVLNKTMHTLIVQDLKYGEGPEVMRDSTLTVKCHGTLADGTVFWTTRGGDPVTFELARLIPGWQAGLKGMKEGGIRRLVVPPIMGYGDKDRLGDDGKVSIPAGSQLTFSIELVHVVNKDTSGPVTRPDGLKIEDIVVGTGKVCTPQSTVVMNYKGTFPDGREFQSNPPGDPLVYPLSRLIKGWQEGVPGMKVGGKRKLYIPWQLAYGEMGSPPDIPPKADLVFEIELLDVK
jgi:peptidylprolyl isomerase